MLLGGGWQGFLQFIQFIWNSVPPEFTIMCEFVKYTLYSFIQVIHTHTQKVQSSPRTAHWGTPVSTPVLFHSWRLTTTPPRTVFQPLTYHQQLFLLTESPQKTRNTAGTIQFVLRYNSRPAGAASISASLSLPTAHGAVYLCMLKSGRNAAIW